LTDGCGVIESCVLVSKANGSKTQLVAGRDTVVKPGDYDFECTTSGGMCQMEFADLAKKGCDVRVDGKSCNDSALCTTWSSREGNCLKILQCESKAIDIKGIIWARSGPCDVEHYTVKGECPPTPPTPTPPTPTHPTPTPPTPTPPTPPCKNVDFACAKCGQILECYVDASYGSPEFMATKNYIEGKSFCDGSKTKCGGQQCALQEGLKVYAAKDVSKTCPVLGGFKCKAGDGGMGGAGLSNWATYRFNTCDDRKLLCSEKCDSGKQCTCKYGAGAFCSGCS
jgi:hypothetical protein